MSERCEHVYRVESGPCPWCRIEQLEQLIWGHPESGITYGEILRDRERIEQLESALREAREAFNGLNDAIQRGEKYLGGWFDKLDEILPDAALDREQDNG